MDIYIMLFIILTGIWILFATIQDLRKREVDNWLSFSLIIFALGFRFFYSLFNNEWGFIIQGVIGLGIFFALGHLFYYLHVFAGGDAKLMIALGTVLPVSSSFSYNLKVFLLFFILFFAAGAIYGLLWSLFLVIRNFRKFKKRYVVLFKKNKAKLFLIMFSGLVIMLLGFFNFILFFFGIFIFVFSYLLIYAKAIEEVSMIRKIEVNKLTEGDWLNKDLKVGKGKIKANWEGLSIEEIELIKKKFKKVEIKQGIPFVPVFLISFILLVYFVYSGFLDGFYLNFF